MDSPHAWITRFLAEYLLWVWCAAVTGALLAEILSAALRLGRGRRLSGQG